MLQLKPSEEREAGPWLTEHCSGKDLSAIDLEATWRTRWLPPGPFPPCPEVFCYRQASPVSPEVKDARLNLEAFLGREDAV